MTGLEAIPKIASLLGDLIKRAKDRETQALVQEIQTHQLVIHKDLVEAYAKIAKMEADHAHAITAIREGHRLNCVQFDEKIAELKGQLSEKPRDFLDDYEHLSSRGFWIHKVTGKRYCGSCLLKNIPSPLTAEMYPNPFSRDRELVHTWKCGNKECGKTYRRPFNEF